MSEPFFGYVLRIKYVKQGRLAFLSHLETIRSMERVIRRARLPYAISEGFNPHMKVSFGPALPVGAASDGEYLDLRLKEMVHPDEALAAMRACSVPDLSPVACQYIDFHADAVTVAFPISDWEAVFENIAVGVLQPAFDALLVRGYIEVKRKPKKRRGPLETKQIAFDQRLLGAPVLRQIGEDVKVSFTTLAQDQGSLRPDKFLEAALGFCLGEPPRMASLKRAALRPKE